LSHGNCELDRQRQRVQSPTDRRDDGRVGVGQLKRWIEIVHSSKEQANRGRGANLIWMCRERRGLQGQRPDAVLALASDPERGAARGEHSERDHGREEVRDERCRVEDVFEVVEKEQRGTAGTRRAHAAVTGRRA
jgi:hypothetical protein